MMTLLHEIMESNKQGHESLWGDMRLLLVGQAGLFTVVEELQTRKMPFWQPFRPLQGLQAGQGMTGGQSPLTPLDQTGPPATRGANPEDRVCGGGPRFGARRLQGVNTVIDTRLLNCRPVFAEATLKVLNTVH